MVNNHKIKLQIYILSLFEPDFKMYKKFKIFPI